MQWYQRVTEGSTRCARAMVIVGSPGVTHESDRRRCSLSSLLCMSLLAPQDPRPRRQRRGGPTRAHFESKSIARPSLITSAASPDVSGLLYFFGTRSFGVRLTGRPWQRASGRRRRRRSRPCADRGRPHRPGRTSRARTCRWVGSSPRPPRRCPTRRRLSPEGRVALGTSPCPGPGPSRGVPIPAAARGRSPRSSGMARSLSSRVLHVIAVTLAAYWVRGVATPCPLSQ